jgi:FeS assembly SUF system regulator
MLRISKLTDYAIIILGHLARSPNGWLNVAELSSMTQLASPTVSKVLKCLTKAEILTSTRGARGGYHLTLPADSISIAQIIDAMEGPIAITECSESPAACLQALSCRTRDNWSALNEAIRKALDSVSLAEMSSPIPNQHKTYHIPVESLTLRPIKTQE